MDENKEENIESEFPKEETPYPNKKTSNVNKSKISNSKDKEPQKSKILNLFKNTLESKESMDNTNEDNIISTSKRKLIRTQQINMNDNIENNPKTRYLKLIKHFGKAIAISAESINLTVEDDEKRNIIHRACFQLKYDIINSIKNRLNIKLVNQLDIYGNSPLILSCKNPTKNTKNRAKIIEILINNGADVNIIEPVNGWTALHWICYNGDLDSIKLLMKNGAIVFQPAYNGWFSIDLAGNRLCYSVVKYLIECNIKFLENIGEYELLESHLFTNIPNHKVNEFFRRLGNSLRKKNTEESQGTLDINQISPFNDNNEENKDENEEDLEINIDLTKFPPFVQTVYLRLYTEHCLFWASYFDLSGQIINKYLISFHANPTFLIFSRNNQSAIHAACTAGSVTSFQLIMNKYLDLVKNYDPEKEGKVIMILGDDNHTVKNIVYPNEFNKYQSSLYKNEHFSKMNENFQYFIYSHLKYIIYPKTIRKIKDLDDFKDNNGNVPFNLAAKYSKYTFLNKITYSSKKYIQNVDKTLSLLNKEGLSGYYYLKNNDIQEEFLMKSGKKIYPLPNMVLELNKNNKTISSINLIMKIGLSENLKVSLMEHHNPDKIYLCVDIGEKEFFAAAEQEKLEIRLLDKYLKLPFVNLPQYIEIVEPFLSRQYQQIISKILYNLIDTDMLKNQKIINKMFFTHKPNVTQKIFNTIINRHFWWPNPMCYLGTYIYEGKEIIYASNNLLWRYFGESIAMYYTFYAYFTIMYSTIGIIGIIYIGIYTTDLFLSDNLYPTYFLIYTVWHFVFMYKWRRKCSEIELKWGMKISGNKSEVRPEFNGDEFYRDLDSRLEKHVERYSSVKAFILLLPVILGLLIADIIIFYYTTKWEDKIEFHNNFLYRYIPSIIRSIGLTIISYIYDYYAWWSNYRENYKQKIVFENVLIIKIIAFRLVSDLTAVLYNAFVTKEIDRVKTLLYTNIIIKYLTEIGLKFFYPICVYWIRRKYYFNKIETSNKIFYEKKINLKSPSLQKILISNNEEGELLQLNNKTEKKDGEEIESEEKNEEEIKSHKNENKSNISKIEENNSNEIVDDTNRNNINSNNNYNFTIEKNLNPNNSILLKHKKIIEKIPYRRVSFITGKIKLDPKKELQILNINPDFIEVENILLDRADLVYDYADIVSIHATCALFAILIPFAPIIVFVFSILSQNAVLYVDINYRKRPASQQCIGIGLWLYIIQFIEIFSVIFNSFMLYFYNYNMFNQKTYTVGNEIDIGSGEKSLVIVTVSEHILIFLIFSLNFVIPDVPSWVKKEMENLSSYYQVTESQKQFVYEEIKKRDIKNIENEYQKQFSQIEAQIMDKDEKIREYENNLSKLKLELLNSEDILNKNDNTIKIILNNLNKLNSERNGIEYPRIRHLVKNEKGVNDIIVGPQNIVNDNYFPEDIFIDLLNSSNKIDIKFDEILQKASNDFIINKKEILPNQLREDNKSVLKTYFYFLLRNTFDSIEKSILYKKMSIILNNVKCPIIICDLCLKERGSFICNDCNELYCEKCKKMHLSNEIWKEHNVEKFSIPEIKNRNILIKKNNNDKEQKNEEDNDYNYIKMEEFSFPIQMTQNLGYENLNELFNILYNEYIIQNGILENNIISAKTYIQFKMEFVTQLQKIPEKTLEKGFDNIIRQTPFNLLEIFIINRVCYKIFKFYGSKAKISQLFFTLKSLQTSTFEQRLKILLNILDIYDNNLILKSEFEKFLGFFSYQSYYDYLSINNIIASIYVNNIDYIQLDYLYTLILSEIILKKLFKYLLQFEDEEE